MIQELFGGSNVGIIGGERSSKLSSPGGLILDGSPSHSSSPSSSAAAANAASGGVGCVGSTTPTTSENLRCPRCDSSNTKFCYYNNYNLTQPRHFCKTCRRYWTKGGALRNVPIGGGCRKNKSATITAAVGKSNSAGKMKTGSPDQMGKSGLFGCFEHGDHHSISQNPILWASSQNSHLLSLLRANPNPNPNQFPSSEASMFGSSHFSSETSGLSARALGLDNLGPGHVASIGLSNSFYRNQAQPGQGIILGEAQSNGLQELYQRLRSSTSCYPDHSPVVLGNVGSASNSAILESAPVGTGELGFWNSTLSWPTDLPTTNGAYP
ncbi:hypothetical protein BUALT_Bualt04G0118600 [Buddleja alternifolia]|uniref:Dof zinc finger protein n=1 Tax=Buddleja alternifolia TaxID=168488 RepID=A0AAV6XYY8_9LAMI|nr:hypothetical protein BUALT_Bualt04G0118600 [Buddleja alternifolia]